MQPRESVWVTLEVMHGEIWQVHGVHSSYEIADAERRDYNSVHADGIVLSVEEWQVDGARNHDVV